MSELNKKIKALPDGEFYNHSSDLKEICRLADRLIIDNKALVLENEKLQNEVELLRNGVDHYADFRRWTLSDKRIGDADLYQPLADDDIMLTHGFDFARQIQAQVKGEGNE